MSLPSRVRSLYQTRFGGTRNIGDLPGRILWPFMTIYLAEFIGTAILILLGNGVVANVKLRDTKGTDGGWIMITAGWSLAVYTAVLCVGPISGAHINPAVSVGLAAAGVFDWALVPGYVAAQVAGAFVGAVLVYLFYGQHFAVTDDADAKLAVFCPGPAIRDLPLNTRSEIIGTFVLVFAVLLIAEPSFSAEGLGEATVGLGSLGALPVALVVFAIGLSLGGTTGYAINPARDLGPRLAHAVLPIPGKRDSDWSYASVPLVGPLLGAVLANLVFRVL
jgi:glycerol uptake facilitator protein